MKKPTRDPAGSGWLIPGIVYEISTEGPTPLGPRLRRPEVPNDRPGGGSGQFGTARFGLERGAELVPGYQLVSRIGEGRTGEFWQASGPGGFALAMKFVGLGERDASDELHSLTLMKDVRHANLMTIFGVWELDGLLVVGMDLADESLGRRWRRAVATTGSGIPRRELVEYMEQAASGLDFLNRPPAVRPGRAGASLLHCDVKPGNLYLVGGRVKLGDFGRVASLEESTFARDDDGPSPEFIPPEWSDGPLDRNSDQFALAMTYCRLRAGPILRPAATPDHWGQPSGEPDLSMLPARERAVVSRALARNPGDRWPDCRAFALELGRPETLPEVGEGPSLGGRIAADRPERDSPPGTRRGRRRLVASASLALVALVLMLGSRPMKTARLPLESAGALEPPPPPPPPPPRSLTLEQTAVEPAREVSARLDPVADPPIPQADPDERFETEDRAPEASSPTRLGRVVVLLRVLLESLRELEWPGLRVADPTPTPPASSARETPAPAPAMVAPRVVEMAEEVRASSDGRETLASASSSKQDRMLPPALAPKAAEREPAKALAAARPRPATIHVFLPGSNAELVVRGEVGRGNPDEWYGPKRVIHTPPIGEARDYLIGSFWTDQAGRQMTRTKELKVKPGQVYEVDLRVAEPTVKEVER